MAPEHHQTFIKSLWWNDHIIDENLIDFGMCAHVFGLASSASVEDFGKEAADVMQKNVYVDDLFKSVEDIDAAKIREECHRYVQDWCI